MAGKKSGQAYKRAKSGALKADIFVSVGTHPQQFDRLLMEIDSLAGKGKSSGKVFAQIGHSAYNPQHFECKDFVEPEEFAWLVVNCRVFVTHAGEGNVGLAKSLGKKFVCVPRRREFGEHTNNHQLELAKVVEGKGLGLVAWSVQEIEEKLKEAKNFTPNRVERGIIVQLLDEFVRKEMKW